MFMPRRVHYCSKGDRDGMKKVIHVNQHIIKKNRLKGENKPPLTCKTYKSNTKCHEIEILDSQGNVCAKVVHRPDKPLSCGARVWIETDNEVRTL